MFRFILNAVGILLTRKYGSVRDVTHWQSVCALAGSRSPFCASMLCDLRGGVLLAMLGTRHVSARFVTFFSHRCSDPCSDQPLGASRVLSSPLAVSKPFARDNSLSVSNLGAAD